ncbi:MAG: hypothetical protein H6838_15185 [Planctomycetes bacterium]|nr:hypothetical protein [Planctomycetota bacterium]
MSLLTRQGGHFLVFCAAHGVTMLLDVWLAGHWDKQVGPWLTSLLVPGFGLVAACAWALPIWSLMGISSLRGPMSWMAGIGGAGSALATILRNELGLESPMMLLVAIPFAFGTVFTLVSPGSEHCPSAARRGREPGT